MIISSSSISIERISVVPLGLDIWVGGNLNVGLFVGLGVALDNGMSVGINADGVVNLFSSYCVKIFSWLSTLLTAQKMKFSIKEN